MRNIWVATFAVVVLVLGALVLVVSLGGSFARWCGYAESMPLLGLFALFMAGHFVVSAFLPRRRRIVR